MDARKVAEENKMLEFMVGSKLYGTDTEASDTDYSGVFMPHENMVYGFERAEEVDLSVKSKRADGKNDENAVDKTLYEFRKFVRLAMDNNPNVLEQMFVNRENLVYSNYFGEELLRNAHLFPHRGLAVKYKAYAFSQKHKMVIRTDNFHALENAQEWLADYVTEDRAKQLLVEVLPKKLPFMSVKGDNVLVGDLNFQRHFMLRKVKKMVDERLSKVSNRRDLLTNHGYDTKFASHLLRLLLEGKELLSTGRLEFPLRYRQTVLDVKLGKWKMTEVLKYADELELSLDDNLDSSVLPKRPRYDEVQELVKRLIKEWFAENK
jgi:predicted nucleotidyltransferase